MYRRKDRPKHVECHSKINKFDTLVHVAGFTIGIILRVLVICRNSTNSAKAARFFFRFSDHAQLDTAGRTLLNE